MTSTEWKTELSPQIVGGTPLIVNDNDGTLDKTWQEIYDAVYSGRNVYFSFEANIIDGLLLSIYQDSSAQYNAYNVVFAFLDSRSVDTATYVADSVNDYPVAD